MESLLEETVPGGGHASLIVKRGQSLRLTDLRGGANVSLMLFNAARKKRTAEPARHAQVPAHREAHRRPLPLLRHGPRAGRDRRGHVRLARQHRRRIERARKCIEKYGAGRYQELRNAFYRNGTDNLLVEMGKWGLGSPTC